MNDSPSAPITPSGRPGNNRLVIKPGPWEASLRRLLDTDVWRLTAVKVRHSARRDLYYLPAAAELPAIFITCHHASTTRDRLKNVIRCRARQEYEAAAALAAAGVPVIPVLAWSSEDLWVAQEIPVSQTLTEHWTVMQARDNGSGRRHLLQRLGEFMHRLAQAGVRHPDLHRDTVLVVMNGEEPLFYLRDVRHATLGAPLTEPDQGTNLFLAAFEPDVSPAEYHCLWRHAWPGADAATLSRYQQYAREAANQRRLKLWSERKRRYLAPSSLCSAWHPPLGGHGLRLMEFADSQARDILAAYLAGVAAAPPVGQTAAVQGGAAFTWLKRDRKRQVARVQFADESWVVKEFITTRPVQCLRPDTQSWLNAHLLRFLGLPVATALAWCVLDSGHGVIIHLDVGGHNLGSPEPALATRPGARHRIVQQLGSVLGRLHAASVFPSDCKTSNFMVATGREWAAVRNHSRPETPSASLNLVLIDTDAFTQTWHGHDRRVRRCFAQLLESLPACLTLTASERRRFLAAYRQATSISLKNIQ